MRRTPIGKVSMDKSVLYNYGMKAFLNDKRSLRYSEKELLDFRDKKKALRDLKFKLGIQ
jgi:hypothetical protein